MAGKAHETCCSSLAAHPQSPAYRGSQGVVGWCQEKKPNLRPVGAGKGQRGPSSFCKPGWAKGKAALAGPSWAPIQLPTHRRCLPLSDFCSTLEGHNSSHLGTSWGQFSLSEPGSACPWDLGGGVVVVSGGLLLIRPVPSPMDQLSGVPLARAAKA